MRRAFRLPFTRERLARDVDDEIAFHIATRVDSLVAGGMPPDEARRTALRQFGDIETVRRSMLVLSQQREASMQRASARSDLRQDLVYGIRTLRRSPGFTALVVVGLALGIGANATIFSLIEAVLLRPLPVERPHELIVVGNPDYVTSAGCCMPRADDFSYPLYRDVREQNPVFTDVLATGVAGSLRVRVEPGAVELEHPTARFVSGNYFSVLGVRPAIGSTLDATDDVPGAIPRATIGHGYWKGRLNSDPSVIGRVLTVNDVAVVISGVTPPGFTGEIVGSETDLWLPIATHDLVRPNDTVLDDRRQSWLLLIGRAKPGLTLEQVSQQLTPVIRQSILSNATPEQRLRIEQNRETFGGLTYHVTSGARGLSTIRSDFTAPLAALMIGTLLLVAIVCVNVANLLLARGVARGREMSLRLAIGANRFRLVRQLLTEGLLLALVSAAAAVLFARWGSRALVVLASEGSPIGLDVSTNGTVLAFTVGLSVASVLLFGLVPALRASNLDLATALRAQSRSIARGATFGAWLIAAQVMVSLVLVASAATLTRSLREAEATDLGFDHGHVVTATLDIGAPGFQGDRLAERVRAVRDRILTVPGVAAVTYSENGLFAGTDWSSSLAVPGFVATSEDDSTVATDLVGPGYAAGIGGRIIAGRDLAASDEGTLPGVAVVNESLARFYFPRGNAVGQFVRLDGDTQLEIVGVMGDVNVRSLERPTDHWGRRLYLPYLHAPDSGHIGQPSQLRLLVRTRGAPQEMVEPLRRAIASLPSAPPLDDIRPVDSLVRVSIRQERLLTRIATVLGVLALVLAGLGLYGIATYTTARRTNEFGVRVVLGARAGDVAGMVIRDVLRPVVGGGVIGVPVALVAMKLMQRYLASVTTDVPSVVVALLIMAASAVVAGTLPALRASRTDPAVALRAD